MNFFRITLTRSAIGLPRRTTDVLKSLGLKKRMGTVFHPVSQDIAGKIMRVKELVEVREIHLERKPDPGYYVEKRSTAEFLEQRGQ
ncbi:hypothetical protein P168DRAFT_328675 [Aspergillus campestris IBT 28561]|uniref:Large ribosomal subunit protein uL30m n=1 Tax=Aspergillus campestris (strain IBT 28561) TaxID=1392248 RepID=A0A2I1CYG6_ASPC2|nr:uncharacterized protein P168DRAFT_328675 [Aspergillus campestris IBT 28561]PKY02654.1 hypothetical protein P168DRAFT_328675 [Aspergillus campestris IBT 28561]